MIRSNGGFTQSQQLRRSADGKIGIIGASRPPASAGHGGVVVPFSFAVLLVFALLLTLALGRSVALGWVGHPRRLRRLLGRRALPGDAVAGQSLQQLTGVATAIIHFF